MVWTMKDPSLRVFVLGGTGLSVSDSLSLAVFLSTRFFASTRIPCICLLRVVPRNSSSRIVGLTRLESSFSRDMAKMVLETAASFSSLRVKDLPGKKISGTRNGLLKEKKRSASLMRFLRGLWTAVRNLTPLPATHEEPHLPPARSDDRLRWCGGGFSLAGMGRI